MSQDYTKDGLLHCGKCNTPKELVIQMPAFDGTGGFVDKVVGRLCDCERAEREKAEELIKRSEQMLRLNSLLKKGHKEADLLRTVYFKDMDADSENVDKVRKFVDKFEEFRADGIGLMFYGTVGNGKTYTAAALANELIEQMIPVAFFSTATYMNLTFEERDWIVENHRKFPLLVLDDVGVERTSDYGTEQIFNLVDSRYKSGLPMIVTTNKLPSELEAETDIRQKRINDRLMEMCLPVQFRRESRRKAKRAEKMAAAKKFFA